MLDDNTYEVRVGGTDTHHTVNEAAVSLHPVRAAMGVGNAGSIYVNMGQFVRSHGLMHTDGLYNCIAVVAHHDESGYAAFTHFNTAGAFQTVPTGKDNDDGGAEERLELDMAGLRQLKARLLQTLQRNVGVLFYVVLGISWRERPTDDAEQRRIKRELETGLNEVFAPFQMSTGGSRTASWEPLPPFPTLSENPPR